MYRVHAAENNQGNKTVKHNNVDTSCHFPPAKSPERGEEEAEGRASHVKFKSPWHTPANKLQLNHTVLLWGYVLVTNFPKRVGGGGLGERSSEMVESGQVEVKV